MFNMEKIISIVQGKSVPGWNEPATAPDNVSDNTEKPQEEDVQKKPKLKKQFT